MVDNHQDVPTALIPVVQKCKAVTRDSTAVSETCSTVPSLDILPLPTLHEEGSIASEPWSSSSSLSFEEHAVVESSPSGDDLQCPLLPWDSSRFETIATLGECPSNKGHVLKMRDLGTGGFVAVKRMPIAWVAHSPIEFAQHHPNAKENPWCDIATLSYLNERRCDYVCEMVGAFMDEHHAYLVSSLAQCDLFTWSNRCDEPPSMHRERLMAPIAVQLLRGLQVLHDFGVAHRDVSLENAVIVPDGRGHKVQFIDFGCATLDRCSSGTRVWGKIAYQAPEMYHEESEMPCDFFLSDAFAVGIAVFGLVMRFYPWQSVAPGQCAAYSYVARKGVLQMFHAKKHEGQRLTSLLSGDFITFLACLLAFNPHERLSLGERCWEQGGQCRHSVWSCRWVQVGAAMAAMPGTPNTPSSWW